MNPNQRLYLKNLFSTSQSGTLNYYLACLQLEKEKKPHISYEELIVKYSQIIGESASFFKIFKFPVIPTSFPALEANQKVFVDKFSDLVMFLKFNFPVEEITHRILHEEIPLKPLAKDDKISDLDALLKPALLVEEITDRIQQEEMSLKPLVIGIEAEQALCIFKTIKKYNISKDGKKHYGDIIFGILIESGKIDIEKIYESKKEAFLSLIGNKPSDERYLANPLTLRSKNEPEKFIKKIDIIIMDFENAGMSDIVKYIEIRKKTFIDCKIVNQCKK